MLPLGGEWGVTARGDGKNGVGETVRSQCGINTCVRSIVWFLPIYPLIRAARCLIDIGSVREPAGTIRNCRHPALDEGYAHHRQQVTKSSKTREQDDAAASTTPLNNVLVRRPIQAHTLPR